MNANLDMLTTCDAAIRDGDESALVGDLMWADHVRTHRVNVKSFFENAATFDGTTLYRTVGTWRKTTSIATAVLRYFETLTIDTDDDTPLPAGKGWVRAIAAIHAWNDARVANGENETFSLQGIANIVKPPTARATTAKPEAPAKPDTAVETVVEPAPTTDQLSVILAALPNLTVAELATLATAVGQERTRKSTLVIAA